MRNIVIYTSIFGSYDILRNPWFVHHDIQYICFTDSKHLRSNYWKIVQVESNGIAPNIMNRKYKLLPHIFLKEFNVSIYVDGNVLIKGNVFDLISKYIKGDILLAVPFHNLRNCVYDEIDVCVKQGKVNKYIADQQKLKFISDGFPPNFGLSENNVLIRKHMDPSLVNLSTEWWNHFNIIQRDQLSLQYLCWKFGIKFVFIPENTRGQSSVFWAFPHKNDSLISKYKIYLKLLFLAVKRLFFC